MSKPKGLTAEQISNWLEGIRTDLKTPYPTLHKAGIQQVRARIFELERGCNDPIEQFTTLQLYQEIAKRNAATVIVYSFYPKAGMKEQVTVMNTGPVSSGLGLIEAAKGALLTQRYITIEDATPDEEEEEIPQP